jgi:hypothetical protein
MFEKVKDFLHVSKGAFTAILVGSIMAIVIGGAFLLIGLVLINALYVAIAASVTNASLNTTLSNLLSNISTAFTIGGVGLIVAGFAGIMYMLIGLGGVTGGRR